MSKQRGTVTDDDGDESTGSTDQPSEPTEQEVFDILSNRRRRYALYALADDGTATIGSLAEQIAAWENDCTVADITPAERKRVYTALQQSHLPKLERTGLISFDRESGRVRPTDTVDRMDIYLEVVGEEQLSWDQYYLGLSAVSVGIVVAVWLNLPFFRTLSPLLWLAVVVSLFTVSAAVHNYRSAGLNTPGEPPEVSDRS
jgi:DNA-binding transcriptional ArsR family regulator